MSREPAFAAVHEGWLLHRDGRGERLAPEDPDLALLEGDRLYAEGLEQLAADGDLEAIAALADVISLCARSHAEDRPEVAEDAWANTARSNRSTTSAPPYSSSR